MHFGRWRMEVENHLNTVMNHSQPESGHYVPCWYAVKTELLSYGPSDLVDGLILINSFNGARPSVTSMET